MGYYGRRFTSRKSSAVPRSSKQGGTSQFYSSRKTTGLYTSKGAPVKNPSAYVKAGGRAYNIMGKYIRHGSEYARTCQTKSIQAAARKAQATGRPVSYVASMDGGNRKYVGYSNNPVQRTKAHLSGQGAVATRGQRFQQFTFQTHSSEKQAKAAETRKYYREKNRYGIDHVRGAGHTKGFGTTSKK